MIKYNLEKKKIHISIELAYAMMSMKIPFSVCARHGKKEILVIGGNNVMGIHNGHMYIPIKDFEKALHFFAMHPFLLKYMSNLDSNDIKYCISLSLWECDRVLKNASVSHCVEIINKKSIELEEILNEDILYDLLYDFLSTWKQEYRYIATSLLSIAINRKLDNILPTHIIIRMSFLYDIGMFHTIPEYLKMKKQLIGDDKRVMQSHTFKGCELLKTSGITDNHVLCAAAFHHERLNGNGYPKKINDNKIPYSTRIISIVDAYFAMICPRIDRNTLTPYEAFKKICNDKGYDRKILHHTIQVLSNVMNKKK